MKIIKKDENENIICELEIKGSYEFELKEKEKVNFYNTSRCIGYIPEARDGVKIRLDCSCDVVRVSIYSNNYFIHLVDYRDVRKIIIF